MEKNEKTDVWHIRNLDAPLCPDCGTLCSGYDRRLRHCIGGAGVARWFALRRLRCPSCKKLHIEMPAFMQAGKHYEARVIRDALAEAGACPADDSTLRRWRKTNPPGSPV